MLVGFEVEQDVARIGPRVMLLNARKVQRGGDGEEELILLAIEDVSERRWAERKLAVEGARVLEQVVEREHLAREDAEAANRAKDVFLATLSHELRSPLHAVLQWVVMLREGRLDAATASRALETIERNTRAQAQLIED